MYQLFCPYGNLLSVRIMVEKDTGRSRGFGFVSYDSPDSAAHAIKELNGFAIGNKRLKVQHKQIREQQKDHHQYRPSNYNESYQRSHFPSLPPAGPNSTWQPTSAANDNSSEGVVVDTSDSGIPGAASTLTESSASGLSPLTTALDPLRNALPDVSSSKTSPAE